MRGVYVQFVFVSVKFGEVKQLINYKVDYGDFVFFFDGKWFVFLVNLIEMNDVSKLYDVCMMLLEFGDFKQIMFYCGLFGLSLFLMDGRYFVLFGYEKEYKNVMFEKVWFYDIE